MVGGTQIDGAQILGLPPPAFHPSLQRILAAADPRGTNLCGKRNASCGYVDIRSITFTIAPRRRDRMIRSIVTVRAA
jgi:hypothetical protein